MVNSLQIKTKKGRPTVRSVRLGPRARLLFMHHHRSKSSRTSLVMDCSTSQASSTAPREALHLDSLPEVVESVSQAQKQQTSEIEYHHLFLTNLQQQLVKEKAQAESLRGEMRTCLRKICLCQEDTNKKKGQCSQLLEAVNNAVLANASLNVKLERSRVESEKESRLFQKYEGKMEKFTGRVEALEAEFPDNVELMRQKTIVTELEKERDCLKAEVMVDPDSGELLAKVQLGKDHGNLQVVKGELQEKLHQLQNEVSKEVSKQANIKQDTEVLQKRNQAQLTRLKCQLKEAQLRNWQWSQEASQLERQLETLTGQSREQHEH